MLIRKFYENKCQNFKIGFDSDIFKNEFSQLYCSLCDGLRCFTCKFEIWDLILKQEVLLDLHCSAGEVTKCLCILSVIKLKLKVNRHLQTERTISILRYLSKKCPSSYWSIKNIDLPIRVYNVINHLQSESSSIHHNKVNVLK